MSYPSDFKTIQDAVMAKARLSTTTDRTSVKNWINQCYAQVCIETEALQREDTITMTANAGSYTIPSAIVRIIQIVSKQAGQSAYGPPLQLVDLDTILRRRQADGGSAVTNGTVTHYAVVGQDELEVWPNPGGADTLLVYYVKQPTALSGDTDLPVIPEPYASKCLEYGALCDAYDYLKDPINQQTAEQKYAIWISRYRGHLRHREGGQTKAFAIPGGDYRPPRDPSTDTRRW